MNPFVFDDTVRHSN